MLIQFFIIFITLLVFRRWLHLRKWDHFPGFSTFSSIPLVGHAPRMGADPVKNLEKFRNQFGDIFRMDLGERPSIIISGYENISEVGQLNKVIKFYDYTVYDSV